MTLIFALALALTPPSAPQAQPLPPPELPTLVNAPLLVTHYWPPDGGINCADDCTTFGSGEVIQPHHVNTTAACPTSWRGKFVFIPNFGGWWCGDSGTRVGIHWTREHGLHGHVDVLRPDPIPLGPHYEWRLLEPDEVQEVWEAWAQ